jgi:hypothetical protein
MSLMTLQSLHAKVLTLLIRLCTDCLVAPVVLLAAGKAVVAALTAGGVPSTDEPDDVAAERLRVEGLGDYEANPIVVRHLNKTYPGLDGQPPKVRGDEQCA